MNTSEIKSVASRKRVAIWMIADKLGISENTLYRWLRHDLPEEKQQQVLDAIREIVVERTKL